MLLLLGFLFLKFEFFFNLLGLSFKLLLHSLKLVINRLEVLRFEVLNFTIKFRVFHLSFNLFLSSLHLVVYQDVAPNFLSESLVVTMHEPEEGAVLAWTLGSFQFQRDINFLLRFNDFLNFKGDCLKVITVSLDEKGILGPSGLSLISECPDLNELSLWLYLVLLSEVFLNESSTIYDFLLNRFLLNLRFIDFLTWPLILGIGEVADYA